jgi:hypothetical protein
MVATFTLYDVGRIVAAALLVEWAWWRWRFEKRQAHWREYVATLERQLAMLDGLDCGQADGSDAP